jgi:polyhydroxyalkanoate synthesis regulator phasin
MPDDKTDDEKTAKKADTQPDLAGIVENAFYLGLGALEVTREQVVKFTGDLVDRGKMSQSDAKKVADDFADMAKKQQAAMRKTVETETDRVMKASGVATKSDVDALKDEIAELKAMLAAKAGAPKATKDAAE